MNVGTYIGLICLLVVLFTMTGCATYDACKDPNSYIEFTPRMCHASYRPEEHS